MVAMNFNPNDKQPKVKVQVSSEQAERLSDLLTMYQGIYDLQTYELCYHIVGALAVKVVQIAVPEKLHIAQISLMEMFLQMCTIIQRDEHDAEMN